VRVRARVAACKGMQYIDAEPSRTLAGLSGYVHHQDFTGTGDLVAALLLAWSDRLPGAANLPLVLEKAGASVQAVLQRTHASGRRELCLVPPRPKKWRRSVQHSEGCRRAARPWARPRARARAQTIARFRRGEAAFRSLPCGPAPCAFGTLRCSPRPSYSSR